MLECVAHIVITHILNNLVAYISISIALFSMIISAINASKFRFNFKMLSNIDKTSLIAPLSIAHGNKASLVAHITLLNKSAYPITVYDITQSVNNLFEISVEHKYVDDLEIVIPHMDGDEHYHTKNNTLEFPLHLNQYECAEGFIIFSYTNLPDKNNRIKVNVKTTRGVKKFAVKIYKETDIFDSDITK